MKDVIVIKINKNNTYTTSNGNIVVEGRSVKSALNKLCKAVPGLSKQLSSFDINKIEEFVKMRKEKEISKS